MKNQFILIISIILLYKCQQYSCKTITTVSGSSAPKKHFLANDLIFHEEFNTLNFDVWEHENTLSGNGNWEFQWYTNNRSNSFIKKGNLYIKPTLLSDQFGEQYLTTGTLNIHGGAPADSCTNPAWFGCERAGNIRNILNPIKSARIRSLHSFRFRYGRVEIKAKIPTGDWLWPAIWLLPLHNAYGSWPASGEIDLLESRGNANFTLNGNNIGNQQVESTLHFGPYPGLTADTTANFIKNDVVGYHSRFNKYQMLWTPDYIEFAINGEVIGKVSPDKSLWEYGDFETIAPNIDNPWTSGSKMAPFDQEFYFVINLAVGGVNYFPDSATNSNEKPWKNNSPIAMKEFYEARDEWLPTWHMEDKTFPSALKVDYIKVWAI